MWLFSYMVRIILRSSNLLGNTSRFLFHPVLVDVSQNLWSFLLEEEKCPAIKRVIKQGKKSVENIDVLPTHLLYMCNKFFSLVLTSFKKMWLKLIHLNMYWTLSLYLLSSLFFSGHNEDHSNVACWLLAKQKKPIWSAGDITWRCLGGTSLCPPGMCIIEVYFSW